MCGSSPTNTTTPNHYVAEFKTSLTLTFQCTQEIISIAHKIFMTSVPMVKQTIWYGYTQSPGLFHQGILVNFTEWPLSSPVQVNRLHLPMSKFSDNNMFISTDSSYIHWIHSLQQLTCTVCLSIIPLDAT